MYKRNLMLPVLALIFVLALPGLAAAQEGGRGVLVQVGIGTSVPNYPADTEAVMADADSYPGVDRIKLALGLALGIPVSRRGYVMARVDASGDRVFDSVDYLQFNLYLYSLGVRSYPADSGLYLEAGAGASRAVLQTSTLGDAASDFSYGATAALGYDFRAGRGFGLGIEARYLALMIEGEAVGALTVCLELCWK
jgi:hypothetical protein